MKRVHRIKGSAAVVCGLLSLSLITPACGDDDDDDDNNTRGGSGGMAGSAARAGTGGQAGGRAGSGGTGGTTAGTGTGGTTGGRSGGTGGMLAAGAGGAPEAGSGGVPEAGTGGTAEAGTGGTADAGAGGTPDAGAGGTTQGGASGEGGSGGASGALECLDGCLSLFVPLSGTDAQQQYFSIMFASSTDLSTAVATFRVRIKGSYTGTNGYVAAYANSPDYSRLTTGPRTNLTALTDWTDIQFDFTNPGGTLMSDDVGQFGLVVGRDAGGTVGDVHLEVEEVTLTGDVVGPYLFESATDTSSLQVGYAQNVAEGAATRTWIAPY